MLSNAVINEDNTNNNNYNHAKLAQTDSEPYKLEIVWRNVLMFLILHLGGLYGLYIACFYSSFGLHLYIALLNVLCGLGILAGAHRLWAHRSYKAGVPLRVFLAFLQTAAVQNDIYEWSRDHRLHHKHSDTDADPHNANRGFFFSHIGWLMCKKHRQVKHMGKQLDMSDLWNDPIIRFQRYYYIPLAIVIRFTLFTYVPMNFWGVSIWDGIAVNMLALVVTLNHTWLVNSAAHIFGYKPYDINIRPNENRCVVYLALGEGYHNYHHTFPYDYSASEYGWKDAFNPATAFIDLCAKYGLAYDLRKPSEDMIDSRMKRTGNGGQKLTSIHNGLNYFFGVMSASWTMVVYLLVKLF